MGLSSFQSLRNRAQHAIIVTSELLLSIPKARKTTNGSAKLVVEKRNCSSFCTDVVTVATFEQLELKLNPSIFLKQAML